MHRVALIGENSIEYVDRLLDIWNNGNCAVLIDWRIPLATSLEMMAEANVEECYIERKYFDNAIGELYESISFKPYDKKSNSAELIPQELYTKFKDNYTNNEAIILYSSGTTGKSKGIILSHFAISTNADAIIDYMQPQPSDCLYISKTMSHSSTLIGELLVALKSGMKAVIAPTIVPPRYILNNIFNFKVSVLCLNPTLMSFLIEEIPKAEYKIFSLRAVYVSGSILNNRLYKKARETFVNIPVFNVYGLSEAGPRVAAQLKEFCMNNSVGKPLKNVKLAIVDERGLEVPNGKTGIIHVSTPSCFSGYVCGESKHQSLYRNWLNTGDVGYIDENKDLHIIGRVDDVIIFESHKIYPSEVENQVLKCGSINDCAVVKVSTGENEFLACLYTGEAISEREFRHKLQKKLPSYEIPRRFIWRSTMPTTLNGKPSKLNVEEIIIHMIETEQDNENSGDKKRNSKDY